MNKYIINLLSQRLVILIFLIILSPAISFADADKIFKENSKAVVVVIAYDEKGNPISQGSGFIVRPDGAIVTNYHVISNAKNIKVKTGDKTLDVEGLIHIDKENDLILLKAKGQNLPTVRLGDIEKAVVGEKVYVISSPQGLENTISDGILSGIREIEGTSKKILQITAPVSAGSSGGPVFNKSGEVIGIATFLIEGGQNLNFAMPVNLIKDKISSKKVTSIKTEIEDYKKTAEYWFVIGYYFVDLGMYKEAIEAYKQAIRIKPDYARAHYGLGFVYLVVGDRGSALNQYKILKELDTNLANELFNMIYK